MNARKSIAVILTLAFIVRVSAMLVLHTWIFPTERAFGAEEGEIAYALANGQGYSWPQTWRPVGPPGARVKHDHPEPTTWKAPVNPIITALAFRLFGSYSTTAAVALESFQVVLSVLSCYVLFRIGRTLFNEGTGLIAALIFALYPASIHFSVQKLEYGTLLTFLGLLIVQQTIGLSRRPGMSGSLALGALFGIATLVNPVILAFFPFALLWLVWTGNAEWKTRLKSAAAILGCCVAVMMPWLIRNYLVFDQFVFIRSNFARELVKSNFPQDARALAANNARAADGNDGHVSSLFSKRAFSLVIEKPAAFLRKTVTRVPRFWTYLGEVTGKARLAAGAGYYSVLCLGLAGLWIARGQPQIRLPLAFLLTMPIPFYLTWASRARFRFPLEPILALFAAYALASMLSRLSPRKSAFYKDLWIQKA